METLSSKIVTRKTVRTFVFKFFLHALVVSLEIAKKSPSSGLQLYTLQLLNGLSWHLEQFFELHGETKRSPDFFLAMQCCGFPVEYDQIPPKWTTSQSMGVEMGLKMRCGWVMSTLLICYSKVNPNILMSVQSNQKTWPDLLNWYCPLCQMITM